MFGLIGRPDARAYGRYAVKLVDERRYGLREGLIRNKMGESESCVSKLVVVAKSWVGRKSWQLLTALAPALCPSQLPSA